MASAVIFDMNGVIVDDERIHQESWRVFCQRHGFQLTDDEFKHNVFGRRETDTFADLFQRDIGDVELEELLTERVTIAMDIFRPNLHPTEGADEFIQSLYENKVPIAVATSARKPYTSFILDGLDIRQYFNAVVTAEEVVKGKPDPEIFLKAAEAISTAPEQCVVIEDSLSGIRAAKAAGMEVIGITTTDTEDELRTADKVITSFRDISPATIEGMRRTEPSEGERLL
jgi:beta-phosphoglucomutase